jgi:hypothetical protein
MGRKSFSRLQIQEILETNSLNAQVSYIEREETSSPDNYIIYFRLNPNNSVYSDDQIHMRKALVQVVHFHKKKLDSIADLVLENFNVEPIQFDAKQLDTSYMADYYRFEVLTFGAW